MPNTKPMFSIVTAVYNDAAGLDRTKRSIATQTFQDFEWIVIDGKSSDGTVRVLQDCDLGNMQWVSEKDEGIYDAMNRGVAKCTGEYVVFMNAGDTFQDAGTLGLVEKELSGDGQLADILFGGAMLCFPRSGKMVYRAPRSSETSLWHGLPANHQATYYRRTLLERTPYDLLYPLCGDYYLAAALMKNGAKASYLDKPVAIFEVGGQSYKRLGQLFSEPYRIQRDVLGMPLHYRLASAAKRLVSTLGFILLSQPLFRASRNRSCVEK
jgi:putative colanic acid biosynthesis glycosyltransferase